MSKFSSMPDTENMQIALSYSYQSLYRDLGRGWENFGSYEAVDKWHSELIRAISIAIRSRANTAVNDYATALRTGAMFIGGVDLVRPPDLVYTDQRKEGSNNDNFEARKKAGEIIMSDYLRGRTTTRVRAGICSQSNVKNSRAEMPLRSVVAVLGIGSMLPVGGGKFQFFFNGGMLDGNIDIYSLLYSRLDFYEDPKWVYPDVQGSVLDAIANASLIDPTSLVTNVAAKAGKSSIDLLTAAAELPKTVKSGVRGAKLVAKILKDFKRREFSLSTGYMWRKQRMTERYKKQIARLDRELNSNKLSSSRRVALQSHRNKVEVGHREFLIKTADELATEIANLWMNYRYNIMVNVYLLQDAYAAVENFGRQFVTVKGTQRKLGSVEMLGGHIQVNQTMRVVIKRKFGQGAASQGGSVISNDLFVTAWELTPLSYVADWIVNIGDNLLARTYFYQFEQEMACLSSKIDIQASMVPSKYTSCLVPPMIFIEGFYYKRQVINPQNYCGLVWQPSVGLERQLDALALGWRAVRSSLLNRKKHR